MITLVGNSGNSAKSALICGSTVSTIEPAETRTYLGGSWLPSAFFTVFRETPTRRAIARIAIPSLRRSLRISAQSSTFSTP